MPRLRFSKATLPLLICLTLAGCFQSSEERAAEHYENGLALMAEGDNARAMVEFRNTLKYAKTNLDARRRMAEILLERGSKKQAYRNYLAVVETLPEDIEARTALSELAFDLGDWGEFKRHADQAARLIETAGDTVSADLLQRAEALDMALRFRTAVTEEDGPAQDAIMADAERMQQIDPDNVILRKILINAYVAGNRYEDALEQLDAAIAAEPKTLENYGARLELLGRMGNEADLEIELVRMVELFPNDQNVRATYLRYLTSRGKTQEAETFLRAELANKEGRARSDAFTTLVAFILTNRGAEAALEEVNTAIAEAPTDQLRLMRATLSFDSGNREAALSELEALITAEETGLSTVEQQEAKTVLARMLEQTGNEVGAQKLVEEVLASDPNDAEALKLKAGWQIDADDTDNAINGLRAALDANPDDTDAMQRMARAYQRAGNTALMLNFLSQAVEASNNAPEASLRYARALIADDKALQAETVLINSLRIAPGNVNVLSLLGNIYLQLEDTGRAQQVIATLRKIDTEQSLKNANALNIELVARQQGADKAIELLEGLAEGDSDDALKLALVRARLTSGDTEAGLAYAKELTEEDPDNLRFRYALALTHLFLRDADAAEQELQSILDRDPRFVQVWLQLARIHAANGSPETSLAIINDGLEAVPDAPDLLWGKASLLENTGDIDGAIEIFETLYEKNSDSLIVANNLASMLTTYRGDPDSIARASRISRRLAETNIPAMQDTYGWIAYLNGNNEEAVQYLEPAAAGLPRDMGVQLHLGLVYAALDRREDAMAQLRRALELGAQLTGRDALLEEARSVLATLESGESTDPAPSPEN